MQKVSMTYRRPSTLWAHSDFISVHLYLHHIRKSGVGAHEQLGKKEKKRERKDGKKNQQVYALYAH